jgi:hypothetical protein
MIPDFLARIPLGGYVNRGEQIRLFVVETALKK